MIILGIMKKVYKIFRILNIKIEYGKSDVVMCYKYIVIGGNNDARV